MDEFALRLDEILRAVRKAPGTLLLVSAGPCHSAVSVKTNTS